MKPITINLKELREKFPDENLEAQKRNDALTAFFREKYLVPISMPIPTNSIEIESDKRIEGIVIDVEYWVGLLGAAHKNSTKEVSPTKRKIDFGGTSLVVASIVIYVYNFHKSKEDEITLYVSLKQ